MSRYFNVEADVVVYRTVSYEVEADSFEEAREKVEMGGGYPNDYDDYDECINDINSVYCQDCDEDEDECECDQEKAEVDERFFAGIGL